MKQIVLQFTQRPLLLLDHLDRNCDGGRKAPTRARYFDRITSKGSRAFRGCRQENGGRCTRCDSCSGGAEGQEWPFAALGRDTGVEREIGRASCRERVEVSAGA